MSTRKPFLQIIGLAFVIWLLAACSGAPDAPTEMPTPAPATATSAPTPMLAPATATSAPTPMPAPATATALPVPAPTSAPAAVKTGFITGRVHLASPPTPRMVVYALDPTTGQWAFTETAAADGEAPFSLVVPPGAYQVFAFSDLGAYTG